MKTDLSRILKVAAKSSFYVISRTVGFFLLGAMTNAAMLALLFPEMGTLIGPGGGGGVGHLGSGGGPIVMLLVLIQLLAYWPVTLMGAGFGFLFPAAYFVLGQRHGIQKALHHSLADNREWLSEYATDRFFAFMTAGDAKGSHSHMLSLLPDYLKKLDNMPKAIRLIARHWIKKTGVEDAVSGLLAQHSDANPVSSVEIATALKGMVADKVGATKPSLMWFAILTFVNIAAFVVIKIAI